MNKKILVVLLSFFLCCSLWSCGGNSKEKKAKKEQTANSDNASKGDKKKDKKGPAKPGLSVPADNNNDQVVDKISDKKWKLSKWQRSGKKSDKAPGFLWTFDKDGTLSLALSKVKKINGKWAFVAAENKMYLSLPGSKKKGSALDSFSEPFDAVLISDTEMKLKNSSSEMLFNAN